jgi:hypothetical protein
VRKSLLAGLLLAVASCVVPAGSEVEIAWGPSPWYTYCAWDAPCWYGDNRVFVYGWGYVDRPTYVYLYDHPARRDAWEHRRRQWHPGARPAYRGRDWDTFKQRRDKPRAEHDHDH